MFVEDQDVVVGVEAGEVLAGVFDAESDNDSADSDRAVAGGSVGADGRRIARCQPGPRSGPGAGSPLLQRSGAVEGLVRPVIELFPVTVEQLMQLRQADRGRSAAEPAAGGVMAAFVLAARLRVSGYDLTCRSGYDLTCRFRQGDHVMGSVPATRVRRSLSR